LSCTNCIIV
jgi:hypothetical protein